MIRIESRPLDATQAWLRMSNTWWDGAPLTRERGIEVLGELARKRPDLYGPFGTHRLVVLDLSGGGR